MHPPGAYPRCVNRRLALLATVLLLDACSSAGITPSAPAPSAPPTGTPAPSTRTAEPAPSATPSAAPAPAAWSSIQADGPAAREDLTWTVGDGRTAFLFGGRDGSTVFGDLWAYDLDTDAWQELATPAGPAPRFGHEAVWVDGVGLVVFAGQAGPTFFNDLWAYDPATSAWRELPAGGDLPVSRYGTCAALGPDGRLWISHGFTSENARFSDTRAYDFASGSWTDETPGEGARPVERCLHGCWWTDDGALTLYAGQTTGTTALGDHWSLSSGSWTELEGTLPPARNLYARARLDGATLVAGGQALDGGYLGDVWLLPDAGDPVAVEPEGVAPPARAGAELIVDDEGGRLLLFGGRDADGAFADLWQLSGVPAIDG